MSDRDTGCEERETRHRKEMKRMRIAIPVVITVQDETIRSQHCYIVSVHPHETIGEVFDRMGKEHIPFDFSHVTELLLVEDETARRVHTTRQLLCRHVKSTWIVAVRAPRDKMPVIDESTDEDEDE